MHAQTLNSVFPKGTWKTLKCQSIHAHAHYVLNAKQFENIKYLGN